MYTGVYLWSARLGATIFVFLQQIILIDVAYNWNEDWIDRADQADRLIYGSGNAWLKLIIGTCATFYITTMTGTLLLYKYFGQCTYNTWMITLTLFATDETNKAFPFCQNEIQSKQTKLLEQEYITKKKKKHLILLLFSILAKQVEKTTDTKKI